jgi:lipoprotein NlpD
MSLLTPSESSRPRTLRSAWCSLVVAALASVLLVACGTKPNRTVVVEDRPVGRSPGGTASTSGASPSAPASGGAVASGVGSGGDSSSNAGRPGYYTVKPGDTLVRIGLDHGQNWRDIARWNQIDNPNVIEVGQVLRVAPEPGVSRAGGRAERPSPVATAPRPAAGGAAGAADSNRETGREANRDSTREVREREVPADAVASSDPNWAWPSSGPLLQGFDEQRNKGLDIGGKAGDPVLAAADGRVVYAGSALRGYGNLVILKHNATFLSAYAHNQTLLVKEDQVVKRGQKIAEMGSSDAERVQLHFEIRRDGKPVDPARYLPAR